MTCRPADTCKCNVDTNTCQCNSWLQNLSTPEKVGAGVVAGIVLGVSAFALIVTVGGKKGYDYYKERVESSAKIEDNPLYVEKGGQHDNPLYEPEE
jgi:hypothetical protein